MSMGPDERGGDRPSTWRYDLGFVLVVLVVGLVFIWAVGCIKKERGGWTDMAMVELRTNIPKSN